MIVELWSCERGVPKPRNFNGSIGAVGGRVLRTDFFWVSIAVHIPQVITPLSMRRTTFSSCHREEHHE
jgi:hypothetical protein